MWKNDVHPSTITLKEILSMSEKQAGTSAFLRRALHLINSRFLFKKPRLFLRTIRIVAIYLFTKKNVPWDANIGITCKCNLDCNHCFAKTFMKTADRTGKKELRTEEMVAVIKEQLELGVINFELQGGEPFLHPDLEKLIMACEPHRSYININTNGILLTDEWIEKFKKLGVDQIVVSIDSGIPKEHDLFRNREGSWEKGMAAIEKALKHGFTVTVNTTVTHESLYSEGIKKLNEFCLEKNVVNWLFIGIPIGNWSGRTDVLIDEKDHEYMAELARKTNNMIRRDLSPHLFRSGCPAVKEGVYITPYGDVLPCPFIHISLGNIREHKLKDIIDRALTIDIFREHCPVCPIGQDKEFIRKYGHKTFNAAEVPLDGEELFGFEKKLPKRTAPLGINFSP